MIEAPSPEAPGALPDPDAGPGPGPPASRRDRVRRWLRRLAAAGCLGVLVLALGLGYATWRALGSPGLAELPTVLHWAWDPADYVFHGRSDLNILVLGIDYNRTPEGMPYSKGARSDTLLVLNVDRQGQGLRLLSLPRDTMVPAWEDEGHDKLNSAFARGGAEAARQTVKGLLGVPVDHVVAVRVQAAREVVDALGGLRLDVEKDMDYDDHWGNLHIHLKKGPRLLNGEQAVGYARFRNDEEGDLGRIRRQQQVLQALVARLREVGPRAVPALVEAVRRHVDADLDSRELLALARVYGGFAKRKPLRRATLPADPEFVDGLSYMVPREEEVRALASRLLRNPDDLRPEEVRVEVLNGSGVDGAAGRLADQLREVGYQVVRVGDHARVPESKVVDRLASRLHRDRVRRLLAGAALEQPPRVDEGAPDFTVVLGGNLAK